MAQYMKKLNNVHHKNALNSIVLQLQMIHSKLKCQSRYYLVSYGAIAVKICHDTEHKQVVEQHISPTPS